MDEVNETGFVREFMKVGEETSPQVCHKTATGDLQVNRETFNKTFKNKRTKYGMKKCQTPTRADADALREVAHRLSLK